MQDWKGGIVKKTLFKEYDTPRKSDGIIAINIREGDELIGVRLTSGEDGAEEVDGRAGIHVSAQPFLEAQGLALPLGSDAGAPPRSRRLRRGPSRSAPVSSP